MDPSLGALFDRLTGGLKFSEPVCRSNFLLGPIPLREFFLAFSAASFSLRYSWRAAWRKRLRLVEI